MSIATSLTSVGPAVPKGDLLVVLPKGVDDSAVDALRQDGYSNIVTHAKSLAGADLDKALAQAHILGIPVFDSPHSNTGASPNWCWRKSSC